MWSSQKKKKRRLEEQLYKDTVLSVWVLPWSSEFHFIGAEWKAENRTRGKSPVSLILWSLSSFHRAAVNDRRLLNSQNVVVLLTSTLRLTDWLTYFGIFPYYAQSVLQPKIECYSSVLGRFLTLFPTWDWKKKVEPIASVEVTCWIKQSEPTN